MSLIFLLFLFQFYGTLHLLPTEKNHLYLLLCHFLWQHSVCPVCVLHYCQNCQYYAQYVRFLLHLQVSIIEMGLFFYFNCIIISEAHFKGNIPDFANAALRLTGVNAAEYALQARAQT